VREGLIEEMVLIEKYIHEHKLKSKLIKKGDLYYMKLKDYGSEKVKAGDDISLSYTCTFLDGEVFDQVTTNDPVYVNLGTPDQLVQGFESALKEIGEKEEVMVIIPSYLAFGEDGSSNGQVPEKTPIIITATILEKLN
jgi:FKBP-type peptidyl-prolyl cis-trans isomerase